MKALPIKAYGIKVDNEIRIDSIVYTKEIAETLKDLYDDEIDVEVIRIKIEEVKDNG